MDTFSFRLIDCAGCLFTKDSAYSISEDYIVTSYNSAVVLNSQCDTRTFCPRPSHIISALATSTSNIAIGYKDGVILIVDYNFNESSRFSAGKSIKSLYFTKEDEIVLCCNNKVQSYNIEGGESTLSYDECGKGISFMKYKTGIVLSVIESTLRLWIEGNKDLYKIKVFDNSIKDIIIEGSKLILHSKDKVILYDYIEDKELKVLKINTLRSLCIDEHFLYILSKSKVYKYNKELLIEVLKSDIKDDFSRIDLFKDQPVLFSESNRLRLLDGSTLKSRRDLHFHTSPLKDIISTRDKILTLSSEKIILWSIEASKLIFTNEYKLDSMTSFSLIRSTLIVRSDSKLIQLNIESWEVISIEDREKCGSIFTSNRHLIEICERSAKIFEMSQYRNNITLKYLRTIEEEEEIITAAISPLEDIVALATLSTSVTLYSLGGDLLLTLRSHSLPIFQIRFSDDGKSLATASNDKLTKIWGVNFGELQKTLVGGCGGIDFVGEELLLGSKDSISLFKKHSKVAYSKGSELSKVVLCKDYIICGEKGIFLFDTGPVYEEDNIFEKPVADTPLFEEVLAQIESDQSDPKRIFDMMSRLSMGDIHLLLWYLSPGEIMKVVEITWVCRDSNIIVLSRILKELALKPGIEENKTFKDLFNSLKSRIETIREEVGETLIRLN